MYAREYAEACMTFDEFGKIKDIDFDNELHYEDIYDGVKIIDIDFEDDTVTLQTSVEYPCGDLCCGSYPDEITYDLDQLASKGYLGKLIDMMDDVLSNKLNQ